MEKVNPLSSLLSTINPRRSMKFASFFWVIFLVNSLNAISIDYDNCFISYFLVTMFSSV